MPERVLSLRGNFAWNLGGNVVYNLAQWGLLVAIARLGDATMLGLFALCLALSAPIFITVGLNLRVVRATDVTRRWSPRQYGRVRFGLNCASFAVAMAVGVLVQLDIAELMVLVVVCASKAVESTSLLLYGYFQHRERLDLVARSMALRGACGLVLFVGGLLLTGQLVGAVVGLTIGWSAVWLMHDRREERLLRLAERGQPACAESRSSITLVRTAAPLGLDAGIVSASINVPRYAVQFAVGTASLGVFASLAYLAQIVSTITGALGDAVVGPLAKRAHAGDVSGFAALVAKLVTFASAIAGTAATAAWLLGDLFIAAVLGDEFVDQSVLVLLMLGVGASTVQRSLARGLHATQRFGPLLGVDATMLGMTITLAALLVPTYGLDGAAASLGLGTSFGAVVTLMVLWRAVRTMNSEGAA